MLDTNKTVVTVVTKRLEALRDDTINKEITEMFSSSCYVMSSTKP